MRRISLYALGLFALGCMCGGDPTPTPVPPATPPPDAPPVAPADPWALGPDARTVAGGDDGVVTLRDLRVDDAAAPPGFAGPLPALPTDGSWPDTLPPQAWLRARLRAGDVATWDRVDASLALALAGPDPLAAEANYALLVRYAIEACPLALTRHGAPASRRLADLTLASCNSPEAGAALAEPGTSVVALVAWGESFDGARDPRLNRALAAALPSVVNGLDPWQVGVAAGAAGQLVDPEVSAGLRAAHAKATDPELKETIAAALALQTDPEAQALAAPLCSRPEPARGCARPAADPSTWEAPSCAKLDFATADEWEIDRCLPELAAADWAGTRARLAPDASSPAATTLKTYDSAAAWEASLRADGVLVGALRPGPMELTLGGLLMQAGQATAFDVETGQWPNEHEGLLAALSALAGSPLGDVAFGESAPPLDGVDPPVHASPAGTYRLHAWMDGRHYVAVAEDLGDWYDLGAVVGMLNTLARERSSAARWVVLPTGDQTAIVAVLTGPGLTAARSRGLLQPGGTGDAAAVGKNFEEKVFRELERNPGLLDGD